ncbi:MULTISPECIES: hypothetical protein [Bacillales]|uniref:Uncharacterized protein n=1 Tax=Lysinibacillus louembei TaxID=1470088 RepID=A0ABZ0RZ14_9BACI|nr:MULTISPECIES: hypothetical protein [Bacillales]MCT6924083.1 hypothetical protein [Metasolibacillus sp.]MCT6940190.1 hypothetical protein [Metasolibacillus sp.]WPK12246.1 hypothetical protein R6U77_00745 [Lysinibacillus louembei]
MIDFNEKRAERDGIITVKATLEHLLQNVEQIERVFSVVKLKDGTIKVSASDGSALEALGMLEVAKFDIVEDMYE